MRIGLIDVDGHNFPNLALMRISAYHKAQGDQVEWWWSDFIHYDIVYMSKIFSDAYTKDVPEPLNADKVIKGGTGYCISLADGVEVFDKAKNEELPPEIEKMFPDYSLYPQFDFAVSMTSRGCPRGCSFCHVAAKEGRCSVKVADVSDFWNGQKEIRILDPNITACKEKRDLMRQYIETGAVLDFTQGLDIRLLNDDDLADINQMRLRTLHFAPYVGKCMKTKEEMGKKLAAEVAERGTKDMNDYVKKMIIAKKSIAPIITESIQTKQPGIYLFERTDENGVTFFYCGQAKNIFQRIISHWNGYQHIDISMRKRKFKSDENPHGWAFCVLEYCPVDKLDEREQYWILEQMRQGKQTYNVTYGSQTDGKKNIKEGKTPRGYYDGLAQGELNARKLIAHLFDKHLVVGTKKMPPTVNQQKALDKFMDFISIDKGDA